MVVSNNGPLESISSIESTRLILLITGKQLIKAIKETTESRRECLPIGKTGILNKFSFADKRIKPGVNYKVWQDGFHPVELSSNAMMDQKPDYVHNNPVIEEYVHLPEHLVYSSAAF